MSHLPAFPALPEQSHECGQPPLGALLSDIPAGGMVATDQEFAFLAPQEGYTASAEIAMPADRLDWKDDVDLKFFYRLADGRYGRMTFSMVAFGQHFCMIDSFLNPSGSRNLESDPQGAVPFPGQ